MIRIRNLVLFAASLALFLSSNQNVWAGDSDGVTGYSMRLKNKDFDAGDESGSGGGNALYAIGKKSDGRVLEQAVASDTDRVSLIILNFRNLAIMIWLR